MGTAETLGILAGGAILLKAIWDGLTGQRGCHACGERTIGRVCSKCKKAGW